MQFLLKHKLDLVNNSIDTSKYKFEVTGAEHILTVLEADVHMDEILSDVIGTLQDLSENIHSKNLPIADTNARANVFRKAKESLAQPKDKLCIFDDGRSILFVGEKTSLKPVYSTFKQLAEDQLKKTREIILSSSLEAHLLQHLGLMETLTEKTGVTVKINTQTLALRFEKSSKEDLESHSNLVKELLTRVTATEMNCGDNVQRLILLEETSNFIKSRFQNEGLKCYITSNKDCVPVCYSTNVEEAKRALTIVKTNIQTIHLDEAFVHTKEFRIVMNKNKGKYTCSSPKEGIYDVTGTTDFLVNTYRIMDEESGQKSGDNLSPNVERNSTQQNQIDSETFANNDDMVKLRLENCRLQETITTLQRQNQELRLVLQDRQQQEEEQSMDDISGELFNSQETFTTGKSNEQRKSKKQKAGERHRRSVASGESDINQIKSADFGDGTFSSLPFGAPLPVREQGTFKTPGGLQVMVYKGNILCLDVECIVNAANEHLAHGGGIADVITRAAGSELDRDCREYIRKHGQVQVGQCCHTSPGNLPYKRVIHTVGPRWNAYNNKSRCLSDLCCAVEEALNLAEELQLKSIAIPSISAGIFGVPKQQCAQQYFKAVENFSKRKVSLFSFLKEVHFIDKDESMCGLIQQTFKDKFNSMQSRSNLDSSFSQQNPNKSSDDYLSVRSKRSFDRSLSNSSTKSYDKSISVEEDDVAEYTADSGLKVLVYKGNITEINNVESIVCPEDKDFSGRGRIAKALMNKGGSKYKQYRQSFYNLTFKKVESVNVEDILYPVKEVFYVWPPRWNYDSTQNPFQFEADLKQTVDNILKIADKNFVKSVAMPFLGEGLKADYPTPVKTCCECIVEPVHRFSKKQSYLSLLKEIHFIMYDAAALTALKEEFDLKFGPSTNTTKVMETAFPNNSYYQTTKNTENKQMSLRSTTRDTSLKEPHTSSKDETCCICMDDITDPKKLGCGHVFCSGCIDQCFKYKPACPTCGRVFGKVTGDQPPGTMEVRKNSWIHLKGYERYGTIEVIYNIPSGKQTSEHPNPGKSYEGIYRSGYLLDNKTGNLVAELLRIAFDRRLVFTIGRSRTTGAEGVVTWNDIHHKTRTEGGPQRFGYPDNSYLDRVLDELAAKGVTEDSLNDP